ncbi:MAG TPA: VOC family protein, partial [Dehalococcoidia bacterium]|nr:VOC family protein [Dehalococcoidia bacterium]
MAEQPKSSIRLPKVSQLGYVVADIERACKYYESTLGIGPFCPPFEVDMSGATFKGNAVQTKIKVAFVQSGDVQIELIQPLDGNNPYTEYLAKHGDGI